MLGLDQLPREAGEEEALGVVLVLGDVPYNEVDDQVLRHKLTLPHNSAYYFRKFVVTFSVPE